MADIQLQQGDWREWQIADFSGGYLDIVEDRELPDNASNDCENVIALKVGSLKKRPGQQRLGPISGTVCGMHAYYREEEGLRRLVCAVQGSVKYWDPTAKAFVDIKTGLRGGFPTCFETCVNYMVVFNGIDPPWKWDGNTVTPLANAPSDGKFALLFKEKLFTVPRSQPSTVRWSDSFQPESWPAVNYWDIAKGDGDRITCIVEHLGQLVIFKRRSMHILSGSGLDDFSYDVASSVYGCVGPFAAKSVGPYLYFVSDDGLCVWNGAQAVSISEKYIPTLWSRVNKQYLHLAAVTYWNGKVWFALPEGNAPYNNLIIVYDPPESGAVGGKFWPWRGINASCFQIYDDGSERALYAGDSTGGYVNKVACGTDDFGNPIKAYWTTKAFDIGSPERIKKFRRVFIIDSPKAQDALIEASLDYRSYSPLTLESDSQLTRRYRFRYGTYGRYLSLKVKHESLGDFEVRGLNVEYKFKRKPR